MTVKYLQIPTNEQIQQTVRRAIAEDLGSGDLTAALIDESVEMKAELISREQAVLCGKAWFSETFRQIDEETNIVWHRNEGELLHTNESVCSIAGRARSILTAERTALNWLQTLSGTATITRRFVERISDTMCRILDTRKTIPGLRIEQKYAVKVGGATNHRIGLFDGILIKENHITSAGSIKHAVEKALANAPDCPLIEVEVESISQLEQALEAGVTRILLDNFSLEMINKAVSITAGKAELEVSGNVSIESISEIAATGADYISIGALTKHLHAIDYSLRFCEDSQV